MPLPREELLARARAVRAIVLDVDGVLTDASLIYGPRGEYLKAFSARDGFAVKLAQSEGIPVAILSGAARAAVRQAGRPRHYRDPTIQGAGQEADIATLAGPAWAGPAPACVHRRRCSRPRGPRRRRSRACPAVCVQRPRAGAHGLPGHRRVRRGAELVKLVLEARGRWVEVMERLDRRTAAGTASAEAMASDQFSGQRLPWSRGLQRDPRAGYGRAAGPWRCDAVPRCARQKPP